MAHALRHGCLALAALILGFGAAPAHAEYEVPGCRFDWSKAGGMSDGEFDALTRKADACREHYLRLVPMSTRAARGEDALRIWVSYGERSLPIIIEYVRPKHGHASLDIRIYEAHRPRLFSRVSDASFAAVWSRWADQPRIAAASEAADVARASADAKAGMETVCITTGGATVETAHARQTGRVELDPCKAGQEAFMDFMTAHALADMPACSAQAHDPDSNDYLRLMACVSIRERGGHP